MARPPEHLAQQQRTLGRYLAALRAAAGLYQADIARAVPCHRTTVAHAEAGSQLPASDFWETADRLVGANGALIARRDELIRAKTFHLAEQQTKRRARAHTTAQQLTATPQGRRRIGSPAPERAALADSRDCTATGDSHDLVAAADESTALLEWAEAENVGEMSVENMLGELHRVTRVYLSEPTVPLFRRTELIRARAVRLLKGHQRPQASRQLFAAAGWSTTVMGWMANDLGESDLADNHLRAAWCCAEFADSNELRAWVRAAQHTVAFWRKQYSRAVFYAADGLGYAASGSSHLFLASALAIDLAKQGDRAGALDALRSARDEADRAEFSADLLAGPFSCSHARAASGLWSDAYLVLEQPRASLEAIAEGVGQSRRVTSALQILDRSECHCVNLYELT